MPTPLCPEGLLDPVELDERLDERPRQVKLDERSRSARGTNGWMDDPVKLYERLDERPRQVKLDERSRSARGTNGAERGAPSEIIVL